MKVFLRLIQQQHVQVLLLQAPCIGRETVASTYIHDSLHPTKSQPLPGLHPKETLNCVNKPVTESRCNSLNSDLQEKFMLRLHRYFRKRFAWNEMHFGPGSCAGQAGRGDAIALTFFNPHGTLTPSLSCRQHQIVSQCTLLQLMFSHLPSPSNFFCRFMP